MNLDLRAIWNEMKSDQRFAAFDVELHAEPDTKVPLSIDLHDVAEFLYHTRQPMFAIGIPVGNLEALLGFLDFLEAKGIKEFDEVALFRFDHGASEVRVDDYDDPGDSLSMYQVRNLVKALVK